MQLQKQAQIQTPFGIFCGIEGGETDESGRVANLRLNERNMVLTHVGELIPYYREETPRRRQKPSVSFHPNGMIKTVYLEEQQEIETPIGEFPAECVTFYDTGELNRFFPQYGKISGFWSEDEERGISIPFHFQLDCAEFTARLSGVSLYKSGNIRSITLFPGETISVRTPRCGEVPVRIGFSLYENGALHSFEPASPVFVPTPLGRIAAYDAAAVGVNADSSSVVLEPSGGICAVTTSSDRLVVTAADGTAKFFAPREQPSPLDENASILVPMRLEFDSAGTAVTIGIGTETEVLSLAGNRFQLIPGDPGGCSPERCAGCSLCSG
jgi:hypothetical protein